MKKRTVTFIVPLVIVVGAAVMLVTHKAARNASEKPPIVTPVVVETIMLKTGPVLLTRHASAEIEAQNETVVMSRLNAYVTDLSMTEGDRFKAGDILMKLDLSEASSVLQRAQANLAQVVLQRATLASDLAFAESSLNAEKDKYARMDSLYKIGGVSLEQLQKSESVLAAVKAKFSASNAAMAGYDSLLQASRAAAAAARENLRYGIIRAPFGGTISHRLVQRGDLVTPGKPLLKIIDIQSGVRLFVDMPANVEPVALLASSQSYPLKAWPEASAEGMRRYEAHAPSGFVPGSRINVQVVIAKTDQAVLLPEQCLLDDDGKSATVLHLKDKAHIESLRVLLSGEGDEGATTTDAHLFGVSLACASPDILTRLKAGAPFQIRGR